MVCPSEFSWPIFQRLAADSRRIRGGFGTEQTRCRREGKSREGYALAAERYFGEQQGKAWVAQLASMIQDMVRITVTPEWVGLLDFQTRFPSALPL